MTPPAKPGTRTPKMRPPPKPAPPGPPTARSMLATAHQGLDTALIAARVRRDTTQAMIFGQFYAAVDHAWHRPTPEELPLLDSDSVDLWASEYTTAVPVEAGLTALNGTGRREIVHADSGLVVRVVAEARPHPEGVPRDCVHINPRRFLAARRHLNVFAAEWAAAETAYRAEVGAANGLHQTLIGPLHAALAREDHL